jgi:hypothetical protein
MPFLKPFQERLPASRSSASFDGQCRCPLQAATAAVEHVAILEQWTTVNTSSRKPERAENPLQTFLPRFRASLKHKTNAASAFHVNLDLAISMRSMRLQTQTSWQAIYWSLAKIMGGRFRGCDRDWLDARCLD